jgi:hypothetical protein
LAAPPISALDDDLRVTLAAYEIVLGDEWADVD